MKIDNDKILEYANSLETIYGYRKNEETPIVQAALGAAAMLRKVVDGELVELIHARWKLWSNNKPSERAAYEYFCSACSHRQMRTSLYCPSCGAKMDKEW